MSVKQNIASYKTEARRRSDREKALKRDVDNARWEAHRNRELLKAKTQSPSRIGRTLDVLGEIGEHGTAVSKSFTGSYKINPYPTIDIGLGSLSLPGESRRHRKHRRNRGRGDVHIHVSRG